MQTSMYKALCLDGQCKGLVPKGDSHKKSKGLLAIPFVG